MHGKLQRLDGRVLLLVVLLGVASLAQAAAAATQSPKAAHASNRHSTSRTLETAPLSPEEQAAQVLNRFTFGPRPGEVAEVATLGWESWFEQQLHPASIADPVLDKRLAQYPALQLSPSQLASEFPDGAVIRKIAAGKAALPADPELAGVYQVLLARYQRKQAEQKAETQSNPQGQTPTDAQKDAQRHQDKAQARVLAEQVLGYPKNRRMAAILALPVEQRMVLTASITEPEKTLLSNDLSPHEREIFAMMAAGYSGNALIANEMQQAKMLRAVLSERQLQEVMTDFWINHFNIDLGKSGDMLNYAPGYERDAIRAHALGKFRDLLLATAEHPAMLIYLDNWLSTGPDSPAAGRPQPDAGRPQPDAGRPQPDAKAQPTAKAQTKGLNENYGREVMELHTVGVEGGYTQADVTALAEILTGWTVRQPNQGGPFAFDPRRHEPGDKIWFGQHIPDGGMSEGVDALSRLAAQPQTAHFLSFELAQRFVADNPPPALVDRMAAAYMSSDGDIGTVLHTMVHAPEFFARANYRNKVKTPLEYLASSLRATDTDPSNPGALVNVLKTMGEPLYRCLPPTGYLATADRWMNSAALVDRLNYALQLTGSRIGGMHFDAPKLLAAGLLNRPAGSSTGPKAHTVAMILSRVAPSGQDEAILLMEQMLVPGPVSAQTNAVIRRQLTGADRLSPDQSCPIGTPPNQIAGPPAGMAVSELADPNATLDKLAAMILGSPEFQVH